MDLLQMLDDQWASGRCDLATLLQQVPEHEESLALELCAADLEWHWRLRKHAANGLSMDSPPPSASDYRPLLGDRWNELATRQNLYEAEWCARSLWGDEPDVDEFASRLPSINAWHDELARQINTLVPLEVALDGQSLKRPLTIRVSPQFVIGRQGTGDPQAPGWSIARQRLIVANSHFRTISREQLQVRRTRVREIELTNLSRAVPFRHDGFQLQSSEVRRITLPITINVGEVNLRFFLPGDD